MNEDYYRIVWDELLCRRNDEGYWTGSLSASPLSTATTVSAFVLVLLHIKEGNESFLSPRVARIVNGLKRSVRWLLERQNADGGWGDTDRSLSNPSTAMLVKSALTLVRRLGFSEFESGFASEIQRVDAYLDRCDGVEGIRRRYGRDKTFVIPILSNAALAGLVPWSQVTPLPFELAAVPQSFFRFLRLPVVSYAIPALVAIGQLRFHMAPPANPMTRLIRSCTLKKTLRVLRAMQPADGGFLEASPLTAFVLMSMAASGSLDSPVAESAIDFLLASTAEDGSLLIDSNLSCWLTTLTINAVGDDELRDIADERLLNWILSCQHDTRHPFTGAAPGGWAWTHLSGGVPDADDTPGALLALTRLYPLARENSRARILVAIRSGMQWLLNIQNRDGGFPTFCRGWGNMPFDRSSIDLTAHAVRAFLQCLNLKPIGEDRALYPRIRKSVARACRFIVRRQESDGSWRPLWFGNQYLDPEENPYYGTGKTLRALADLRDSVENGTIPLVGNRLHSQLTSAAARAIDWIVRNRNNDDGWGRSDTNGSTIEETAVVLEALLAYRKTNLDCCGKVCDRAFALLRERIQRRDFTAPSPIGFYFTKLWYYEELYPLIFSLAAFARER